MIRLSATQNLLPADALAAQRARLGVIQGKTDVGASPYAPTDAEQALVVQAAVDTVTIAGAVAVNLAAGVDGKILEILDETGAAADYPITITPDGAETIDGFPTLVIAEDYGGVKLEYDAGTTNWKVLSRRFPLNTIPSRTPVAASPHAVEAYQTYLAVDPVTIAGPVAINLAAGRDKQYLRVIDETAGAGTNNITITPNGAETIGGQATLVLAQDGAAVDLYYNAATTDWVVIQQYLLPTPGTEHHEQAVAATASDHAFIAPGAGRITAVQGFPGAAAAAGESMTIDAHIGGVSALTAVGTIDNASGLTVVAGTIDPAANTFAQGDVITFERTYVAGGGPTPIVNSVMEISYVLD